MSHGTPVDRGELMPEEAARALAAGEAALAFFDSFEKYLWLEPTLASLLKEVFSL